MKKLLILIIITTTSCRTYTGYSLIEEKQAFSCENQSQFDKNQVYVITSQDILDCYISDTTSIIWLSFFYSDCQKYLQNEIEVYNRFKDDFKIVIISLDYNTELVLSEAKRIDHPIYFIEVSTDRMRINMRRFIKKLFGEETEKDIITSTNIFVKNEEIIGFSYKVNDEFLNALKGARSGKVLNYKELYESKE